MEDTGSQEKWRAICISLVRRTDRRAQIQDQFAGLGFPWSFLDAIDGRQLPALKSTLNARQRACWMSHREAWRRVAQGEEAVLVLEDDVRVTGDINQQVTEALADKTWDLFYLQRDSPWEFTDQSTQFALHGLFRSVADDGQILPTVEELSGAYAIIVRPKSAQLMLDLTEDLPELPVDGFLHKAISEGILTAKTAQEPCFGLDRTALNGDIFLPRQRFASNLARRFPRTMSLLFRLYRKMLGGRR